MTRKIIGTNKFILYMYNGKNVRGNNPPQAKHFVYKQWGRIFRIDENGKQIGDGLPFTDYGSMITYINRIMGKSVGKNLRNINKAKKKI